jgi:pimeloyl-ACP methyl ester carboxylesterase
MQPLDIPVDGGTLHALRFGDGPDLIVAAHGITASAMGFTAVARQLGPQWSLISLDLRGRGGSAGLGAPYGMDQHAADIAAVTRSLTDGKVVLTGQSMGGYAALRAAVSTPELFSKLVLIDGGLPLPVPPGYEPDQLLELTVGPAIARLRETYASEEAYVEFFKQHPALVSDWNDDMTAYVRYDATGEEGAIRSRVNAEAVYADGRDLIINASSFGDDLMKLTVPTVLLHAPRGMFGMEPGMLPAALVEHWAAQAPMLSTELVPDTNHYTILMTDRPAAVIAGHLQS